MCASRAIRAREVVLEIVTPLVHYDVRIEFICVAVSVSGQEKSIQSRRVKRAWQLTAVNSVSRNAVTVRRVLGAPEHIERRKIDIGVHGFDKLHG